MRSALSQELIHTSEESRTLPDRPDLSDKQIDFLQVYTSNPFIPLREICKQTGILPRTVRGWKKKSANFQKALLKEQNRSQAVSNMSRKRVMRGMLEAVDMARDMRQPNTMITGMKEIGRMCGFYEPERREIVISQNHATMLKEIKTLSREDLLALAQKQDDEDPIVPEIYDDEGVIEHESEDSEDLP